MMLLTTIALLGAMLQPVDDRVQLRVDASQAEAVLALVDAHAAGRTISAEEWKRLFESEPHRRLKAREASLGRSLPDSTFRTFVLSPELEQRADSLRVTLAAWRGRDLEPSARRVMRYLPREARIRATVYPVVKPQANSFVFDLRGDPAIFLYLDPTVSPAQFENTVAHELHHVGFASAEGGSNTPRADLSERARMAADWMGAFGEGFAMLAAAGAPDVHPHAGSAREDRARWDRDTAQFDENLRALDTFFLDILDGRLASEEAVRQRGFSFFGVQGPWYTVGYRMAVLIERRFGLPALVDAMRDPRRVLALYNAAAAEANRTESALPMWSDRLLHAVGMTPRAP